MTTFEEIQKAIESKLDWFIKEESAMGFFQARNSLWFKLLGMSVVKDNPGDHGSFARILDHVLYGEG